MTSRPPLSARAGAFRDTMITTTSLYLALSLAQIATAPSDEPDVLRRRVLSMGTWCTLEIEARDRGTALAASEAALRALEAVEARLSTWREDSELARLNGSEPGSAVRLSDELARDLGRARELWQATGGAFDPTIGALVRAWGLRTGGRQPTAVELAAARAASGFDRLELRADEARRLHADLAIEEGGFGKGVGLDAAIAAAENAGAERALIDLGGQVALLGNGERVVGCAHPRDRERIVLRATLDGGALATTGNSERGIVVAGEPRSHLLDPTTGQPVPDFGSLTVWASDALTADALSTGLYVMGPERALAWAAEHPEIQVLVLLAEPDASSGVRCLATDGWLGRLRSAGDSVRIQFLSPEQEATVFDDV